MAVFIVMYLGGSYCFLPLKEYKGQSSEMIIDISIGRSEATV